MAIEWQEDIPRWEGEIIEPPEAKKTEGWIAGDKPPAKWWNWFMNKMYRAVNEQGGVIEGLDTQLAQLASEKVDRTITVGVGKDFTTIQAAINSVKKRIDCIITINVDAGTYNEDVIIGGFIGTGRLILNGGSDLTSAANYSVKSIALLNSTILLRAIGFTATTTTAASFTVFACFYGNFQRSRSVVSATAQRGFVIQNSLATIADCQISNKSVALFVTNASTVVSYTWSAGAGNIYGIYCEDASTVGKSGTQPQGTTAELTTTGGVIR